LPLKLSYYFF